MKPFLRISWPLLVLLATSAAVCNDDEDRVEGICDDGIDNDEDGRVDCADSDCQTSCNDGVCTTVEGRPDCGDDDCAAFCVLQCAMVTQALGADALVVSDPGTISSFVVHATGTVGRPEVLLRRTAGGTDIELLLVSGAELLDHATFTDGPPPSTEKVVTGVVGSQEALAGWNDLALAATYRLAGMSTIDTFAIEACTKVAPTTCNPAAPAGAQGCAPGQKCSWLVEGSAAIVECGPIGGDPPGGACTVSMSGAHDSCVAGTVCDAGTCRDVCTVGDVCPTGATCVASPAVFQGTPFGVCP